MRARPGLSFAAATWIFFLVAFGSSALPARAATLEVDAGGGAPYSTIQSAIDSAAPGVDNVFVHCGTYVENIVMVNGVSVSGAGPECTVIDGDGAGQVVSIVDVGSATRLEGFTIRNGSSELGGGIYLESSSLTVRGNVIEKNRSVVSGQAGSGQGGGIHITTDLALKAFTEPIITGNVIRGNEAESYGGGIALYLDDGSTIRNNLIENNTAELAGGGVHSFASFPDLVNNTIVRNCLQGGPTACSQGGGGIALTSSAVVDISNNVVAWNAAATGGGGIDLDDSSATDLVSNDVYANSPANYAGVSDPTGSDGNLSVDPLFVVERSNLGGFQPRSDSPLVDAGTAILAPADDLRGIPRPLDGDVNGNAAHDIGARENEGVSRLSFSTHTDVHWDLSVNTTAFFNLYRGELPVLRATGVYTQDTSVVAGARRWCGLMTSSATDSDEPASGGAWFYLAVATDIIEGSLGFDDTPVERGFSNPGRCP